MHFPYYLSGEWLDAGVPLEVRSPHDGAVVGITYRPAAGMVERAVGGLAAAFEASRRAPVYERVRLLRAAAAGIERRADEFASMIAREAGKPVRYARGEVARAVQTFTEAAEECSRVYGELLQLDVSPGAAGRVGITKLFPVGPVLAITPFNFPLNLVAHKVAPAIAAGCPVVVKPSSEAPLTALMLAGVLDEAGAPAGALSVLPLAGSEAGELALRPEIGVVTFTGGAGVGWRLKQGAWNKRVTLELGGNAAVILHEDWRDREKAVDLIVTGGYAYSGQVCISVQRIFVHESLYDGFSEALVSRVGALRSGDPLDERTEVGVMINEAEAVRVESWVREASEGGARILAGGGRRGAFVEPTVVEGAVRGMKVVDEEVFGPVTVLFPYRRFDEALAAVNDSRFGLQAGVFTRDVALVRRAFEELEVGGVVVGDVPTFRVDRMPYGGVKDSGFGREGLRWAIGEMCEQRLLVLGEM